MINPAGLEAKLAAPLRRFPPVFLDFDSHAVPSVESNREHATIDELRGAARGNRHERAEDFCWSELAIYPGCLGGGDARPRDVHDQKWLFVLSGVTFADVGAPGWMRFPVIEEVHFVPDIAGPWDYAVNHHGVPRPSSVEGLQYHVEFQVELWAPFAGVSGSIDEDSDYAQIEVANWRPSPFRTGCRPPAAPRLWITRIAQLHFSPYWRYRGRDGRLLARGTDAAILRTKDERTEF